MAFAVISYFDPDAEANVKAVWDTLAKQDVSPSIATQNIRPHITLIGWESCDPVSVCDELRAFAKSVAPLTVKLSAVGVFPGEQVVAYLAPTVPAELVRLHTTLYSRLIGLGIAPPEFYQPANWVPHCTVALNLPPERIPAVMAGCQTCHVFRPIQLTALALVEYMPVRELGAFPLGDMTYAQPHRNL